MTTLRWSETPKQRLVRRARAIGVTLACLIGLAATSRVVFVDLLQWRDVGQAAREVAEDPRLPTKQRRNGITIIQRDALRSVELLMGLAVGDDEVAQHARNALQAIDEARAK